MNQLFFIERGGVESRDIPPPAWSTGEDTLVHPVAIAACNVDLA